MNLIQIVNQKNVCIISATLVQILFWHKLGHIAGLFEDTIYCSNRQQQSFNLHPADTLFRS